jgi:hypothetical protein
MTRRRVINFTLHAPDLIMDPPPLYLVPAQYKKRVTPGILSGQGPSLPLCVLGIFSNARGELGDDFGPCVGVADNLGFRVLELDPCGYPSRPLLTGLWGTPPTS